MLRAVIIDDEAKAIETLMELLARCSTPVEVVASTDRPLNAVALINEHEPDLLFLDIRMPGMDGFKILEQVSWRGFRPIIITAHQGEELSRIKAAGYTYLLKPVDEEELGTVIC